MPGSVVYACGPPAMLEAVRALCAPARGARPARARGSDGLRLRRLLRLRGRDASTATSASASTGRCSRRRCSHEPRRLLRDRAARTGDQRLGLLRRARGARGVRRFSCSSEFPFAAYVSKTITLAPRAGNPPPRLWESAGGPDQLDRSAESRDRRLPRNAPAPAYAALRRADLITNVMGSTAEEFGELVERVSASARRWPRSSSTSPAPTSRQASTSAPTRTSSSGSSRRVRPLSAQAADRQADPERRRGRRRARRRRRRAAQTPSR
jgi:hypothetical protein